MALKACGIVASTLLAVSSLRKQSQKGDCYSAYDGKPLLLFRANSSDEVSGFRNTMEELACVGAGDDRGYEVLALCSMAQMDEVKNLYGEKVEVLQSDAGNFFRKSSEGPVAFIEREDLASDRLDTSFYTQWRNYDDRIAKVERAVRNSGGAATMEQIGTSVEGRPIQVVRFRGQGWRRGDSRVVISCQLHAREWITGMACVYAVERAAEKARNDASWLAGKELTIVPMANPDGIIYSERSDRMWRKNRATNVRRRRNCKGVDLNRNWDPDWAGRYGVSSNTCSDVYTGPSAFSEPETQAVKDLLDEAPVKIHLDIHSYGEVILRPWSHTNNNHPKRSQMDVPGNEMIRAINRRNGGSWQYGGNELLSPASGVCPDYSTSQGAFGYTYELPPYSYSGGGFAPPASSILPTAEENYEGILAAISWA